MPDGAARTHEADGRLVRRVRLGLVAWSAGTTLVVLLVLGAVIYGAVAATLASSAETLLRERASLMAGSGAGATVTSSTDRAATLGSMTVVTGGDAAQPGFAVDGPFAGTLAVVVPIDGTTGVDGVPTVTSTGVLGAGPATAVSGATDGVPDPAGYAAALAGTTTLREITFDGRPVRVLSVPIAASSTPGSSLVAGATPAGVIQVVGDRSAEQRTLDTLLAVLLGGGLVALVAATLVGALYARRALVPIRSSLRRQRELAADTSHELRTPLAVIRAGVARACQQPDARVADITGTLDAVDAEAVRLGSLVDDLLALARTDAGAADLDLAPVDLAEVAADAIGPLEPLAAARGTRLELDVAPAPMRGDEARLHRLVTVLVDNAVRHGRAGGRVRVTVRPGHLSVEDDGPGIPPADRDRVFDRFWRGAGAAPGGSGLGLAIAAWITERHGGRIRAGASELGGARFDVRLAGA